MSIYEVTTPVATTFTDSVYGLVDRFGNYFGCHDYEHSSLMDYLQETEGIESFAGWLHIGYAADVYMFPLKSGREAKPSSAQLEVLFDALMSPLCPIHSQREIQAFIDKYSD